MGISIDEKRVYRVDGETRPVYVVGAFGVAVVETSDDLVGRFGLERQCDARDAAGADGRLAVATDEDVLVGGDEGFESLGVGPAAAVGFADGSLLVARDDGAVLRSADGTLLRGDEGAEWTELGRLDGVRAIDGELLATAEGVYRAGETGVESVGLSEVRDVSAAGAPLAATDDGLYRLGNGWLDQLPGAFRAVSAPAGDAGSLGRAHAAGEDGLFAHEDGEWCAVEVPVREAVVALDHGEGAYAVTESGTFLLSVGDGWRSQVLGLRGVRAVAAP